MNDIIIKIDTKTAVAYCENNRIGVQHANLQNKLIFEMSEKINGSAWLEYEINGTKNYAEMEDTENGYQIDIKSCLLVSNNVIVDLKITESEDAEGIPIFISTIVELDVYDSINATTEEPEYYPDWKTVADSKIAEMNQLKEDVNEAITKTNNLNIDVSKSGKVATITLTKKDNTTKTVTLSDGTSLMFNWNGTKLGIKTDEEQEYTYVDLIGPQGIQGETGATPNLTIGTVITGNASSATITGTSENPVLNLVLEKGDTGETGATGNGIASIAKTGTSGNIDTYTITYTNGNTSTFTVTNSTVTDQEFDKLTNEVDKYKTIYNVLPKVSDEGTDIELKDTGNAMLAFDSFNGDTSQKTTTGKQLLDTSMYSLGSINGNTGEVEESSSTYRFDKYNEVNPNTTIYLLKHLCIYFYNENKGFISSDITGNLTITTPPNTKYIRFRIFAADFATFNPNDYMVSYTQETHFEPYTGGNPSPSPDYPQPIKVVTGEQNIIIQSKNLFDKSNYSNYRIVSRTTGELVQNNSFGTTDYIKVKANQTYYQSNVNAYYSVLYDENKEYYGIIGTAKFTPAINGYIRTSFSRGDLNLVQVEPGEVATTYTPYQSQTYSLSLGNIELARTNNHKDYIFKNEVGSPYYNADLDLNEWYLHKVIGKATLTENSWGGVRNVTIGGTSRPIFYSRNDIFKSYDSMVSMMCNYFQVKKTYGTSPTANNQFYCNYERTNNLEFAKFDLTTAAEWKEWLSTHNIVLIGKMVNPTNTKITDTTLIQQLENINNNARSYKDTTTIECTSSSEDNETIQASVTALKDISTLFEQVNNAIIEVGGEE